MHPDQIRLFPEPPAAVTLYYYRFCTLQTEEYGSVPAAVRAVLWLEEEGQGVADHLVLADGTEVGHEELSKMVVDAMVELLP